MQDIYIYIHVCIYINICIYVCTNVLYICTLKYMSQGISLCTPLYVSINGYKNTNVLTHGYARTSSFYAHMYIYICIYTILYIIVYIYILIRNFIER